MKKYITIDMDEYYEFYQRFLRDLTAWKPDQQLLKLQISKEAYAKAAALEWCYQEWLMNDMEQEDGNSTVPEGVSYGH